MRVLLLVVIVLAAGRGAEPTAAEVEADLWRIVPEGWRPLPAPTDPGQDASGLLLAAGKAVASSSIDDEAVQDAYTTAMHWRKPWPSGAAAETLLAWLDAPPRREAYAVLDQALALGVRRPPTADGPDPVFSPARDLMRFLLLRVRRATETGGAIQAEADLRRMAGLARSMRGGRGGMALLSRIALDGLALDAVVAVAVRLPPDAAILERLRANVVSADGLGGDGILHEQLPTLIASLAKEPEDGDRWVQKLQAMHLKGALLRESLRKTTGATTPAADRSAIFALAGLSKALDRRATVELAVAMLASITEAGGVRAWQQGPVHDLVAETAPAARYLNPAQELLGDLTAAMGTGREADDGAQADAAFRRLAGQANPVGRILLGVQLATVPMLLETARRGEARCRMSHLALDLLVQRARHGSLPDVLPPGSPPDPCTGAPFRWDAARRLLWSVGRNGTDEQGDPRKDDVVRLYVGPDP